MNVDWTESKKAYFDLEIKSQGHTWVMTHLSMVIHPCAIYSMQMSKIKKRYIAWTEEEKEEENSPQQRADITNCVCNNRLQR